MKCFKSSLVCIGLTFGTVSMYSQSTNQEIKPSVNAQQFISAASGNNSLHTGQLSISIPLFNLEAKGINVPISLYFSGEGITHESEASNVGLGWSLLAGGVITQAIRDVNDLTNNWGKVPWHDQGDYIQRKWLEEQNSPYSDNLFEDALQLIGTDKEPDVFKYSFLGFSGDVSLKYNDDKTRSWRLYPDMSFHLEKTTLGFKLIANDGTEYWFEAPERKGYSSTSYTTSWFLSRINTLQGGEATFHYADDFSYDLTYLEPGTAEDRSKRLTRIDYDYGYVLFTASDRADKDYFDLEKKSRRITNIELYDKEGSLIKGYKLDNAGVFSNADPLGAAWHNRRIKLKSLSEYDHNLQHHPPYEFEYDHYFALSKKSSRLSTPFPLPKNTWAHNPSGLACVDRDFYGVLSPWMEMTCYPICCPDGQQCRTDAHGISTPVDPMDGFTIYDYLCLTEMKLPSGGSEVYHYENHNYHFISRAEEPAVTTNNFVIGKRLSKKETSDGDGNVQVRLYKYGLHDENYQLTGASSGVLVNPTIHTSTKYKPVYDRGRTRLGAFPFETQSPQNSLTGSVVYYREVEEVLHSTSGNQIGKRIYYFYPTHSIPATNYVYLNYSPTSTAGSNPLIPLHNTLYGKQPYPSHDPGISAMSNQNLTYMAYPVGRSYQNPNSAGKVVTEVVLNGNDDIVMKIENDYRDIPGKVQYGYFIEKFDDSGTNHGSNPRYRYLISVSQQWFTSFLLSKRITTHYHPNGFAVEEQNFEYNRLNLPRTTSVLQSNGESSVTKYVYPDEISFQTLINLSDQALSIKKMTELNMIGIPIQVTEKNGTGYVNGKYTTFKQLPMGAIVIDTTFTLTVQPGSLVSEPVVNADGKVERSPHFIPNSSYLYYDENAKPTTSINRDGLLETVVWGYRGQYPIAKIMNCTYAQLQSNTTLMNKIRLLENYTVISDADHANLSSSNQSIRNSLPPNALIMTYTFDPLVGVTSATDYNGQTTYYKYDSFNRLYRVYDYQGNILNEYHYNYKKR